MTKGAPNAPDYGYSHQQLRNHWRPIVEAGKAICARCGKQVKPWQRWDLGHDDRRPGYYSGPEHASCNRSAGARKGNSKRWTHTAPHEPASRDW